MLPLHEKSSVVEQLLPEDPEDRQVFELPEGQLVGGATVVSVYKHGKLVGSLSSLYPIVNVSRKYSGTRLSASTSIQEKDVVRIVGRQYSYNSVIFIQYFGWLGYKATGEPVVVSDKFYKVLAITPAGPEEEPSDFHLYEKVCLEALEEK